MLGQLRVLIEQVVQGPELVLGAGDEERGSLQLVDALEGIHLDRKADQEQPLDRRVALGQGEGRARAEGEAPGPDRRAGEALAQPVEHRVQVIDLPALAAVPALALAHAAEVEAHAGHSRTLQTAGDTEGHGRVHVPAVDRMRVADRGHGARPVAGQGAQILGGLGFVVEGFEATLGAGDEELHGGGIIGSARPRLSVLDLVNSRCPPAPRPAGAVLDPDAAPPRPLPQAEGRRARALPARGAR